MSGDPFFIPGKRPLPRPSSTTPPPSPQHQAPESTEKRRRFFQLTDDSAGEMTIEDFIYRNDLCRSTSSSIKYPHPLKRSRAPSSLSDHFKESSPLTHQLRKSLDRHGVNFKRINCFITSKPGYPRGGQIGVQTLLIVVNIPYEDQNPHLSPARRACQAILEEHGLDGLEVELVDHSRVFNPSQFPVLPNDPHVIAYKTIRTDLIDYICTTLEDTWCSLSFFRVGSSFKTSAHAVVLIVAPFSRYDWYALMRNISDKFISKITTGNKEFDVIIMPGECNHSPSDQSGLSFQGRMDAVPLPGSSIGVYGERGGGTLGGYFALSRQRQSTQCFLTNSHVTRPAKDTSMEVLKAYDIHGVPFDAPKDDPRRSSIHYMALKDVEATKSDLLKQLKDLTRSADEVEEYEQYLQDHPDAELELGVARVSLSGARHVPDLSLGTIAQVLKDIEEAKILEKKTARLEVRLMNAQKREAVLRKDMAICEKMPITLGKVLIASGKAMTHTENILDYALVKIDTSNKKIMEESIKGRLPHISQIHLKPWVLHYVEEQKLPLHVSPNGDIYTGIGDLRELEVGQWYFKVGRTTGFRAGICNGVESYINMAGYRTPYDINGKAGSFKHFKYSMEYIIVANNLPTEDDGVHKQSCFANPGDSGSLILDHEGKIAGLLFGEIGSDCGPIEWNPIGPAIWDAEGDLEEERLKKTEGKGKTTVFADTPEAPRRSYGPSCGIVTPIGTIVDDIQARFGLTLELDPYI